MLRDVRSNVTDGLLGFATATGDGLHIKIGVSPSVTEKPITILGSMGASTIKSKLGLSPLADAVMDAVQGGAARVFCIPVAASTAGTIGEVTKTGDGGGSVTVQGSPNNAYALTVRFTAQGGLNTAAFVYSIDGDNFSDEITVPVTGSYEIEGTGLTIKFTEASSPDQKPSSFLVRDTYTLKTTAPSMTNGDVLGAIEKIKSFNEEFEFVHIVGESTVELWEAVSEAQKELMTVCHKPCFFLMEAAYPADEADGDLSDWALKMEADRKRIKNSDIQVCAAWGRLVRLDGTTQIVNLAGLASGRYAMTKVSVSIGKTKDEDALGFPKTKLLELVPIGYDSTVIELLDVAGYMTFREYDGLDDIFVYHTKMMCKDGSDFRYAEDVRVKNKIIRETRKKALQFKNDDIDLEDIQGELDARAKFISVPLDRMVEDKEISSYETTVDESCYDTFLEDETMSVIIGIVALIAALVLLYNKCEWFRNAVNSVINFFKETLTAVGSVAKSVFEGIGNVIGSVMDAAKATVSEKLSNIKTAYEEHGGGISGVAAAAMEAVKGWYTAGYTFIDNLTGAKLSEIRGKFSTAMSNIVQGISQKFTDARTAFSNGLNNIKNAVSGAVTWFFESGKRIVSTFANGIKSAFSSAVEAVKGGLQKIRNLLPFSDAKEGPLSTLTLSGQRTMTTYAHGLTLAGDAPAEAMNKSLQQVQGALDRKPEKKVDLGGGKKDKDESSDEGSSGKGKQVIIHKLLVPVDLKKIKDLQQLLALLQEVEDYAAANEDGEPGDDEDAAPAPA